MPRKSFRVSVWAHVSYVGQPLTMIRIGVTPQFPHTPSRREQEHLPFTMNIVSEPTVFLELEGYVLTETKYSFQELSFQSLQLIRYTSGYTRSPNTRRKSDTWLPAAIGRMQNTAKRTRFRFPILT